MDTVIIGLDGLDPDLLLEWRSDMPTISELIEHGTFGRLRSSDPPLSSPAWEWFYTGKQGGKHGHFGFTRRIENSYQRTPVNYTDVDSESLWEALDHEGISCGIANVPMTFPPSDLESGYVVAGWPVPNRVDIGRPEEIITELEGEINETYKPNPFPMKPELKRASPDELLMSLRNGMWHHQRAFEALLDLRSVDVFFCVFTATDVGGHYLAWDRDTLKRLYIEQDRAVGELLDSVSSDTNVILVSDHGHAAQGTLNFHINEWLRQEGYLSVDPDQLETKTARRDWMRRFGITRENVIDIKNAIGIEDVREITPQRLFDLIAGIVPASDDEQESNFAIDSVDWRRTVAYSSEQNQVHLNSTGSHPSGVVDAPEEDRVREEIKADLELLEHPRDDRNEKLVTELKLKHEVFEGPYIDEAPDIVFVADDMRCKVHTGFNDGEVFSDRQLGEHRQHGVFITSGDSFSEKDHARDRRILDVLPLILASARCSIPDDIDGEIPGERLRLDVDPTYRRPRRSDGREREYSDTESEGIREQLRGLGYLE